MKPVETGRLQDLDNRNNTSVKHYFFAASKFCNFLM